MNQKKIVSIIFAVLIVVLAGTGGYLVLIKRLTSPVTINQALPTNTPIQQTPPVTSPEPTPEPGSWESLIPTIRTVIGPIFIDMRVELSRPLSIFEKNDITGDDIFEALVDLGTGGAYTSSLTLMRVENDKPVVAQFKQKDGKISPLMFLDGASVMNGEGVVMLPDKNAIYAGHWSKVSSGSPFGSLTDCSVEAYQWNSQTKTFDFSLSLSNEVRPGFCQRVEQ